jgi:hypothetical protein
MTANKRDGTSRGQEAGARKRPERAPPATTTWVCADNNPNDLNHDDYVQRYTKRNADMRSRYDAAARAYRRISSHIGFAVWALIALIGLLALVLVTSRFAPVVDPMVLPGYYGLGVPP